MAYIVMAYIGMAYTVMALLRMIVCVCTLASARVLACVHSSLGAPDVLSRLFIFFYILSILVPGLSPSCDVGVIFQISD